MGKITSCCGCYKMLYLCYKRREWKHMDLTILAPIGAVLALLFAIFQAKKVMSEDEGTDLMKSLSQKIRTGADAYLKKTVQERSYCIRCSGNHLRLSWLHLVR